MSLFVCDECGVIENTALAGFRGYHGRSVPVITQERLGPDWGKLGDGKARCSRCNPEVGKWHRQWDREIFDPERDVGRVVNR